jgi:hypothetical protein
VPFQCGWSLRSSSLKRRVIRAERQLENPWLSAIELRAWRVFRRAQMQVSYGAAVTRSAFDSKIVSLKFMIYHVI